MILTDFSSPRSLTVLSCSDCLARHTEYLDGMMDAASAAQWRAHLAECPACARYDRVLRRGIAHLAARPELQLTPDFEIELQQRLIHEERRQAMRPMTSLAAATLAVAAMLAFAAWLPVLLLSRSAEQPVAVVPASASTVASEIAWHAENGVQQPASLHLHQARRATLLSVRAPAIEPKYTPVVLESPIAPINYVRTASLGE